MATTEPLTSITVQDQSDAATGGTQVGNLAKALVKFVVTRYATTGARDTAYTNWVAAGGTMADGMLTSAAGVPYRRISGTWRINRQRVFNRPVAGLGAGVAITSGGSAETGITSPIVLTGGSSFTLYEAGTISLRAAFRAGPGTGAAQCTIKVNGTTVGNVAISRADATVPVNAAVALASGSHTVSLRVDAVSGGVNWIDGIVIFEEFTAE